MGGLFNLFIVNPIFNLLLFLNQLFGNLGLAIIFLTLIIKGVTLPIMLPGIKSMKKQKGLQPQLDKIKEKFKYDKKKQAEMQMQLMKQHGINPASGCISALITLPPIIALYTVVNEVIKATTVDTLNQRVFLQGLRLTDLSQIDLEFLYLNLGKPDKFYILAILLGILQYVALKMMMPYVETGVKASQQTPDKSDDIAYNIQKQSLLTMPVMMTFFGASMPSGVSLYLLVSTVFSIVQNYYTNGLGGIKPSVDKIKKFINAKRNS